jgi:hypothetical protein
MSALLMGAAVLCGSLATAATEPFKLVVEKDVKDAKGKTGIVASFVSGGKRLCFNNRQGRPWFSDSNSFTVTLPESDPNTPALSIRLAGYIHGIGGGKPFKGEDSIVSVDEANQTLVLTQDYFYAKDQTATFVCKVSNTGQGVFKFAWDMGLTDEQLKSLPRRNDIVVQLTSPYDLCDKLGISYGGQAVKLFTVEELIVGAKPKAWANKTIRPHGKSAQLKLYEKAPESTITVDVPSSFRANIAEAMWYDPAAKNAPPISIGVRAVRAIQATGEFTLDLGTLGTAVSAK